MRIEYTTSERLLSEPMRHGHVVVAMPATDLAQADRAAELMARRAGTDGLILIVMDELRVGFIESTNRAFKNTAGEFFAYVAQDAFAGRLWLKLAVLKLERQHKDMLAFNDGKWHGKLASFGMVRRTWAAELYKGDLFHPSYHSHYGDSELTLIAKAHQQLAYAPNSVLVEVDWDKDLKQTHPGDRATFRRRAKHLFGGRIPAESELNQVISSKPLSRATPG